MAETLCVWQTRDPSPLGGFAGALTGCLYRGTGEGGCFECVHPNKLNPFAPTCPNTEVMDALMKCKPKELNPIDIPGEIL